MEGQNTGSVLKDIADMATISPHRPDTSSRNYILML